MPAKEYLATRLFTDRTSAEREYDALVGRGYSADDINVIMTDEGRKRHFADGATTELGNKALKGAGVGGGVGAVTGGALAAIAAAATVAVPGVGLLVAGPIAAALAGVGAGAVAKPRTAEDRTYFDREWGGDRADAASTRRGL